MRNRNRSAYFRALGALVAVAAFSATVQAQYTVGWPATGHTTSALTTDGSYWDASQFTGSPTNDLCGKIYAAWSAAMNSGLSSATIDARGLTGTQTCSASPFPTISHVTASGRLLLGNSQITTSVTWQIPSRTHVEGMGVAGLTSGTTDNTLIQAGSGLTGAVIQLGGGVSGDFDAQVKSLTVDAAGIASVGILNDSAEEGSTVENVNIWNASGYGLALEATASVSAGNSGPYRNINIQYNSECGSSCNTSVGIGVFASGGLGGAGEQINGIRGIDNVTVSGGTTSDQAITTCILVVGFPIQITNSHLEYCGTGISIGKLAPFPTTNNVEVENVSIFPDSNTAWNVKIQNAYDVLLSGIAAVDEDVLDDTISGNQITTTAGATYYLGFYLLGDTSSGSSTPAVISTSAAASSGSHSPNLEWVAPGGLDVLSALQKPSGSFKIDHPLDPANKYLYHSFVESPDMMDVYNGSVTTDKHGMAVVTLPDYFDALNKDFRYQLTAINTFAQATVAKKIQNNRFAIRTSKPGVEVSWQVTGIRQDAYANAHRVQVEEQKPPREQGHYLHPELFETKGEQVVAGQALGR
jgi:hypothetical protein